jgi:alpha-ketoglutarate-dependent taurine dioxygenase
MSANHESLTLDGVRIGPLLKHAKIPWMIEPLQKSTDSIAWIGMHRADVEGLILAHGALLFRGFAMSEVSQFERFVDAACPDDWVEYREAATPRSNVQKNIFTSTEYPPEFRIYLHNENSHVTSWPLYIFFHCRVPADQGGNTPIADCRGVYSQIPESLRSRFQRLGWLYRRNFHAGSSFTWQTTFGAKRREEVDKYCEENFMVPEWSGDSLTVRYRRWAILRHPRTNHELWFNHGTFFNPYVLEPSIKAAVHAMGEDRMPYNTYYGDGQAIEEEAMRILDSAYASETVSFPWMAGDVLMLDNMRVAHGRESYRGRREVVVAMKRRIHCSEIASYEQYSTPHTYRGC